MIKHTLAAAIIACLVPFNALASDLSNQDGKEYTVRVVSEDSSKTITIQAGATISGICTECVLFLGDSEDGFDVFEDEKVFIKDGKFHIADE